MMPNRSIARAAAAATLLLAGATLACSDAAPTGAPTGATGPRASLTQSARAEHDRLVAEMERAKSRIDANKKSSKAAYDADKKAWQAEEKLAKEIRGLAILRCEPTPYAGDARIIGREGGEIQMGAHRLRIPKNALTKETLIVGESSSGSYVAVEFEPHGLTFAVRPELILSYSHCASLEKNGKHSVVYVNDAADTPFEFPPSSDVRNLDNVSARIAHFSSYMIAYRGGTEPQ